MARTLMSVETTAMIMVLDEVSEHISSFSPFRYFWGGDANIVGIFGSIEEEAHNGSMTPS